MLFVPGSRPDRYDKAAAAGADTVVVDLEDAVAADAKAEARLAALAWPGIGGAVLRVNSVGTAWHADDVESIRARAVSGDAPLAVMLPKADAATVAEAADGLPDGMVLIALIESARGIRDADTVADHPSVGRLVFGSVDYALDVSVSPRSPGEDELLFARSTLVNASRAAALPAPVDGVTVGLDDPDAVERDARRGRDLGFGGKLCLHPRQVSPIHRAFAPTDADVDWARRVVAAVERSDEGAFRLDGEVVDAPRMAQARHILALVG
ncbi:MAG: CoA ester lyase [Jatrophihabitans endophyticus]|nr:CoA ester lyase [Jatrophihabitans endophyticus]